MATRTVEKVIKNAYRITITHVGKVQDRDDKGNPLFEEIKSKDDKGKEVTIQAPIMIDAIYNSVDIRAKHENEVNAFALALKDAQDYAGTLDQSSIDPNNPVTAIVRYPDRSFAYIAINLSDTQCDTCGAPEGVYNSWCPTCQERKKDAESRGSGNKLNALFAAMNAKDTRRGR